ncbi:MAG TPA: LPP20 family lipoprotein [Cyclobacteriaceae bacterium]|nr:LPP20 family lipoprotein [Cyclobacteriaceae bacterium]
MKRLIFLVLIIGGCSPSVTNSSLKSNLQSTRPEWLTAKPVQPSYYIGIGHSTKDGSNNYIQSAKKSALEDLVSEIKVNISSTSVLSQIDINKEFQEKYEQIIQTTVADEIQEFEQVDSWEDDRNYWVYYRLSKQRYKDIKDQQKRDAVAQGLDFFTKAKESERKGELVLSLGFYYQGFRAIEKYLAEPIRLEFEGKEILLTNEIIASMQSLLDKIELSVDPHEIILNRRVAQNDLAVMTKVVEKNSRKIISDLPLSAAFEKGAGDVFPTYKTDGSGQAKILLTKISSRDLEQTVAVKVDMMSFAGQEGSDIYSLVARKMVVPKATVLMKVQRPLVYITATEKSLGIDKSNQQITNRIKNYLANSGFEFTEDRSKAELALDVNANSEKGTVSGSIYITYVTALIRVSTAKDNKEIYATTLDRVKGFSLDYERSSQEAYNKSLETLEKEKLPELLNAILQ